MKKIFNFISKIQEKIDKKLLLGRWGVKNCSDYSTNLNSIYQNRDHCGDTICKSPVKADIYINKLYKK